MKNQLYVIADEMEKILGTKYLLDEFLRALDDIQLEEVLEYIDDQHGMGLFEGGKKI